VLNHVSLTLPLSNSIMRQDELIEILEERPFVPLRLHLSSGRTHVIRHPEMAIVGSYIVAIGIPGSGDPHRADRITHCSLDHIVEVEPVDIPGESAGTK